MMRVIVVTRVGVSGYGLNHGSGGLLHFVKVSVFDAFDFRGRDPVVDVAVIGADDERTDHADETDDGQPPDVQISAKHMTRPKAPMNTPAAVFFGMWMSSYLAGRL